MAGPKDPAPASRREQWDLRHSAHVPIESAEPDATLIEAVRGLRPGSALDLGSGDGRNAVWLASHDWRVTAIDFSPVALDRGRTRASERGLEVEWIEADLLDWEPPEAGYDLVALIFIHLPPDERRRIYRRAASAVAPGGTLVIVAHDRTNLTEGTGGPQDPDVLFTPGEAAAELRGFNVLRKETRRRPARGGRDSIDAVVIAVRRD